MHICICLKKRGATAGSLARRNLDLFSLHEEGPGFPFFHPNGMVIRNGLSITGVQFIAVMAIRKSKPR